MESRRGHGLLRQGIFLPLEHRRHRITNRHVTQSLDLFHVIRPILVCLSHQSYVSPRCTAHSQNNSPNPTGNPNRQILSAVVSVPSVDICRFSSAHLVGT
ncbi:hypothetical protein SLE2022_125250 [Rubroshorea leprosula]